MLILLRRFSLLVVKHLNCGHESTGANFVIGRLGDLLGLVVHGIEFSDFIRVADAFE